MISIEVEGKDLTGLDSETGGHRIQRVPPTERKGRVHTSTVTVAVLKNSVKTDPRYSMRSPSDFRVEWFSGTGCGGQHRNKHQNSCRIIHIPTGLKRESQTRSRQNSQKLAMEAMIAALDEMKSGQELDILSSIRRDQVGSGMRGDKVRTYRFRDDWVEDHVTGKGTTCSKLMSGNFDAIWK